MRSDFIRLNVQNKTPHLKMLIGITPNEQTKHNDPFTGSEKLF